MDINTEEGINDDIFKTEGDDHNKVHATVQMVRALAKTGVWDRCLLVPYWDLLLTGSGCKPPWDNVSGCYPWSLSSMLKVQAACDQAQLFFLNV